MEISGCHHIRSYCDVDLKRQMRKIYTSANMLIRKFYKCSDDVTCYLFKVYCSTMQCSAMLFDSIQSAMKKLQWLIITVYADYYLYQHTIMLDNQCYPYI